MPLFNSKINQSATGPVASQQQDRPFFGVQTKLSIGKEDDGFEQEADKVADQVVQNENRTPLFGDTPFIQKSAPPISQLKREPESASENGIDQEPQSESFSEKNVEPDLPEDSTDAGTIQQKSSGDHGSTNQLEAKVNASKGGGQAMEPEAKQEMESGFRRDFSGVRVHTDSQAVQMNKDLGAQAFTHKNNIYFNEGKYQPDTEQGKHLLAHELTHTVQQGAASAEKSQVQREVEQAQDAVSSEENEVNPAAPTTDPFFEPTDRSQEKSPGEFEQESGQAVKNQLEKETNQAVSEVPVKPIIEEGKPTVLEAQNPENDSEKKIELAEESATESTDIEGMITDAAPGTEGQGGDSEAPNGAGGAKEAKVEVAATEGEEPEIQAVGKPLELPALEPDPAVQTIHQLNNQPPSAADQAESQGDTRTDEEKMAEQMRLASEFQSRVETVRINIQQKTETEILSVREREMSASETIRQNALQHGAQISALIASKKAEIQQGYAQTRALLEAQKEGDLARVETTKAAKIALLNGEMESRRTSFNAYVDEQTQMPIVNATNEANRADNELETAAQQAIAEGESVAQRHPKGDDGHPEARDSVREIARETAKDIRKSKVTIREDLMNTASEFNGGFEQYRTDIQTQINSTEAELLTAINDSAEKFIGVLNDAYTGVLDSLDQKETQDLEGLSVLETQQLDASRENEASALNSIAEIANSSVDELRRASTYILQMVDELGANVAELLAPGEGTPIMSAITELQQNSLAQLGGIESDGMNQLDSIVEQCALGVDQALESNALANSEALTTTTAQASQSVNESSTQREQTVAELRTTLDTSFTSMETALDEMRTEALAGIDEAIEDRKSKIQQANDEFLAELVSQNNEHIETAKQPLTDPLIGRLWSAADRATASWWEGLLAAIGDFILMLIIIVAVAALLVALGVFSTITGALLVIGAILLAAIFIYSLVSRLMDGHGWLSLPLAIADTLGITMIYQGYTNKDIATGRDLGMNTFDRWYSGTTGVLQLITFILPFKSRIPGLRSLRLPRIFGEPNGRGPVGLITRGIKWIEGVGRNTRTRRGGGVEQPSLADKAWSRLKSLIPRRNQNTPAPPKRVIQPGETIVIDDPGRLTYSQPTQQGGYTKWTLYDRETGAVFTHYVKAKSTSGPDMFLDPTNSHVMQNGVRVPVKLEAVGFKWTEIANRLNMEAYVKFFGHRPPNLNGQIWASNLDRFVVNFAEMRASSPPGTPRQQIANNAVAETSFGRGKIAEGYGDLRVDLSKVVFEDVVITDRNGVSTTYTDVPSNRYAIDVEALPK